MDSITPNATATCRISGWSKSDGARSDKKRERLGDGATGRRFPSVAQSLRPHYFFTPFDLHNSIQSLGPSPRRPVALSLLLSISPSLMVFPSPLRPVAPSPRRPVFLPSVSCQK